MISSLAALRFFGGVPVPSRSWRRQHVAGGVGRRAQLELLGGRRHRARARAARARARGRARRSGAGSVTTGEASSGSALRREGRAAAGAAAASGSSGGSGLGRAARGAGRCPQEQAVPEAATGACGTWWTGVAVTTSSAEHGEQEQQRARRARPVSAASSGLPSARPTRPPSLPAAQDVQHPEGAERRAPPSRRRAGRAPPLLSRVAQDPPGAGGEQHRQQQRPAAEAGAQRRPRRRRPLPRRATRRRPRATRAAASSSRPSPSRRWAGSTSCAAPFAPLAVGPGRRAEGARRRGQCRRRAAARAAASARPRPRSSGAEHPDRRAGPAAGRWPWPSVCAARSRRGAGLAAAGGSVPGRSRARGGGARACWWPWCGTYPRGHHPSQQSQQTTRTVERQTAGLRRARCAPSRPVALLEAHVLDDLKSFFATSSVAEVGVGVTIGAAFAALVGAAGDTVQSLFRATSTTPALVKALVVLLSVAAMSVFGVVEAAAAAQGEAGCGCRRPRSPRRCSRPAAATCPARWARPATPACRCPADRRPRRRSSERARLGRVAQGRCRRTRTSPGRERGRPAARVSRTVLSEAARTPARRGTLRAPRRPGPGSRRRALRVRLPRRRRGPVSSPPRVQVLPVPLLQARRPATRARSPAQVPPVRTVSVRPVSVRTVSVRTVSVRTVSVRTVSVRPVSTRRVSVRPVSVRPAQQARPRAARLRPRTLPARAPRVSASTR